MLLLLLRGISSTGRGSFASLLLFLSLFHHNNNLLQPRVNSSQLGINIHLHSLIVEVVLLVEQIIEQGDNLPAHIRNVNASSAISSACRGCILAAGAAEQLKAVVTSGRQSCRLISGRHTSC